MYFHNYFVEQCKFNKELNASRPTSSMIQLFSIEKLSFGVIQVLCNADGGGCPIFRKKALRRCKVQP